MNYAKKYIQLIRKAQLQSGPFPYESHHIFPESIYGKNSVVVKMTKRQHYLAHALLYKALLKRYGLYDKRVGKMLRAFMFVGVGSGERERYCNEILHRRARRLYGLVRAKECSDKMKKPKPKEASGPTDLI